MAMEPLPLGFGDAMDATLFSTLWSFQEELQPQEVNCCHNLLHRFVCNFSPFLFLPSSLTPAAESRTCPPPRRRISCPPAAGNARRVRHSGECTAGHGVGPCLCLALPWAVCCRGQGGLGKQRIRSGLEKSYLAYWNFPLSLSLHFSCFIHPCGKLTYSRRREDLCSFFFVFFIQY